MKNKEKSLTEDINSFQKALTGLKAKLPGLQAQEAAAKDAYDKCVLDCFKLIEMSNGHVQKDSVQEKQITYGPGFGCAYHEFTLRDDDGYTEKLAGFGVSVGGVVFIPLSDLFSLACSVNIVDFKKPIYNYSTVINQPGNSYESKGTYSISLLGMSIAPAIAVNFWDFSFLLGPDVFLNYSATQTTKGTVQTIMNGQTFKQNIDNSSSISGAGVSAAIDAALGYNTEVFGLSVMPKVSVSIPVTNTISRDPVKFQPANKMMSFGVGCYLLFGK